MVIVIGKSLFFHVLLSPLRFCQTPHYKRNISINFLTISRPIFFLKKIRIQKVFSLIL